MIIVLAITKEQAQAAESWLDFLYVLHGRKKADSCLLVTASDVHDEYKIKAQISAEVAFNNVEVIAANPASIMADAMQFIESAYREEFIYLEPDCIPLIPRWLQALEADYAFQPKKFMGAHAKYGEKILLAKHSVYPPDAIRWANRDLIPLSTKTKRIQVGKFDKRENIRPESVLFCSDRSGELIKSLRKELKK